MKQQVVVIGLGRFGSSVARSLYNLGHDVLALDVSEERVQSMMGQVTFPVTGDAANETVLRELGVPDYDAAVVAVGTDIVASVLSTVILKNMGIPYVVARARDDLHGNTLERIGADKVIHAESEMGVRLAHNMFNPNVQEYLELAPNFGFSRIRVPEDYNDKTIGELGFSGPRDKYGLAVMAIKRGRDITLNPDTNDRIRAGDVLILAGRDDFLEQLPS
jgi:trk system potassium uptake protein TrkA